MGSKNALTELAERLASNEVRVVEGDEFPIHLSKNAILDFIKARRIVAELAKVGYWKSTGRPHFDDAVSAVSNCRAIAEEGAGDGK